VGEAQHRHRHRPAWSVVQELGYVLNYMSIQERLPIVFMPVSPPPYLNGVPRQFLSWVIESKFNYIDPVWIAEALEGRVQQPSARSRPRRRATARSGRRVRHR
jgi:hypothetical protein